MTVKEQISTGITTAKTSAANLAIECIANYKAGNNVADKEKKLVALTTWIELLEDYYDKKYNDLAGRHYLNETKALYLLARMNALDYNPQSIYSSTTEGDFDQSFDQSFN